MNRAQRRRDVRYYERREREFDDIIGDFRSWKERRRISTSDLVLTSCLFSSFSDGEIIRHPRSSLHPIGSPLRIPSFAAPSEESAKTRRRRGHTAKIVEEIRRGREQLVATCEEREGPRRQTNPSNDAHCTAATVLYRKSSPLAASSIRPSERGWSSETSTGWLADGLTDCV